MPLTVLVDREAKKDVGECPVDAMMRVIDGRWKGTILDPFPATISVTRQRSYIEAT